ncbi:MAG: HNH endonuclease signature motif containing protein [Myxococcota bacterium]|jgi:5-methylcytosine-specific restriction endonuclease McrA|nr:HNH endonuclease signature motif containing protein [Myxococcota bacterium]
MSSLEGLSNDQPLIDTRKLVRRERGFEVELPRHLAEVDSRRLYLGRACPSMFDYCVKVLGFSECVAYKRIAVARAGRRFPGLLDAVQQGEVHLTGASLIAPHLADGELEPWLAMARGATAREIKQRIAEQKPREAGPNFVRKLVVKPPATPASQSRVVRSKAETETAVPLQVKTNPRPTNDSAPAAARAPHPEPLGESRYSVRFVADADVHAQLEELRDLLRHTIPDGDVGKILAKAITELLERVKKQKVGSCARPRAPRASSTKTPSRHIPAEIRRTIWERDAGRCAYVSRDGTRCGETGRIEFHHQVPWARCHEHAVDNIALRCRAHNHYEAELAFGAEKMNQWRPGSG